MLCISKCDINISQISTTDWWPTGKVTGRTTAFWPPFFPSVYGEEGMHLQLPDCYLLISMPDWNLFRANCWRHLAKLLPATRAPLNVPLRQVGMATSNCYSAVVQFERFRALVENPFGPLPVYSPSPAFSCWKCSKSYLPQTPPDMNQWYLCTAKLNNLCNFSLFFYLNDACLSRKSLKCRTLRNHFKATMAIYICNHAAEFKVSWIKIVHEYKKQKYSLSSEDWLRFQPNW